MELLIMAKLRPPIRNGVSRKIRHTGPNAPDSTNHSGAIVEISR